MNEGAAPAPYGLRMPRYGVPDWPYLRSLTEIDDDGPAWVAELVTFGCEGSRDALHDGGFDAITEAHAGQSVLSGDTVAARRSHTERHGWHRFSMVHFQTRANFVEMLGDRAFLRKHDIYEAAVTRATLAICTPTPSAGLPAGLTVPRWRDVAHPPTDQDSPVLVAHLTRYATGHNAGCPDSLAAHSRILAEASIPHGARDTRTFAVEATVVSSGVNWNELRVTAYPSLAAFHATSDQLAADDHYSALRARLVERHVPVIVRPTLNRLAESLYR